MKERMREAEAHIVASDQAFVAAARSTSLHELASRDFSLEPTVQANEMVALYKSRMAKKKSAGRAIYDELMLAAKDGRCPLCGQRQVSTLDHHLPKSSFPALTVNPNNLIPACADCNKLKLDVTPSSSEEETLHPYFDNVGTDPWLKARVLEVNPAALLFFVEPPANWSDTIAKRVELHFRKFELGKLYAAEATFELSNIRHYLEQIHSSDPASGSDQVREHLENQAESRRRANINTWQTATYHALAQSAWYCDGGFSL